MNNALAPQTSEPRHPIRVVAQRTGLTPATLRAWERRYGVVDPYRSEGGQRLYSDEDVERLTRFRLLSEAGRPIRLVAVLTDEAAAALLEEDRQRGQAPGLRRRTADQESDAPGHGTDRLVEAAFARVLELDGEGLEAVLRRGAVMLGAHPFLEAVVGPLLHRVGTAWTRGELGPANEHLCTTVMERVLDWLADPASAEADGPRMVVATLPGERHGLGARLVAAAAALEGWQVTHLGVDLPAGDIGRAAQTLGANVVALSMVNAEALTRANAALAELSLVLPKGTGIIVGGSMASRLEVASLPECAQVVQGLGDLREALGRLAG